MGQAFGFSVPPAVNIPISALKNSDKKRLKTSESRDPEHDVEDKSNGDWTSDEEDEDNQGPRKRPTVRRESNTNRRKEQFGSKAVAKDHFRSENLKTKDKQWSR